MVNAITKTIKVYKAINIKGGLVTPNPPNNYLPF